MAAAPMVGLKISQTTRWHKTPRDEGFSLTQSKKRAACEIPVIASCWNVIWAIENKEKKNCRVYSHAKSTTHLDRNQQPNLFFFFFLKKGKQRDNQACSPLSITVTPDLGFGWPHVILMAYPSSQSRLTNMAPSQVTTSYFSGKGMSRRYAWMWASSYGNRATVTFGKRGFFFFFLKKEQTTKNSKNVERTVNHIWFHLEHFCWLKDRKRMCVKRLAHCHLFLRHHDWFVSSVPLRRRRRRRRRGRGRVLSSQQQQPSHQRQCRRQQQPNPRTGPTHPQNNLSDQHKLENFKHSTILDSTFKIDGFCAFFAVGLCCSVTDLLWFQFQLWRCGLASCFQHSLFDFSKLWSFWI